MKLYLYVKLKYQSSAIILSFCIKYSMVTYFVTQSSDMRNVRQMASAVRLVPACIIKLRITFLYHVSDGHLCKHLLCFPVFFQSRFIKYIHFTRIAAQTH